MNNNINTKEVKDDELTFYKKPNMDKKNEYLVPFSIKINDINYSLWIHYDSNSEWNKKGMDNIKSLVKLLLNSNSGFGKILEQIEFEINVFGLDFAWVEV